jgi:hypothetical protein
MTELGLLQEPLLIVKYLWLLFQIVSMLDYCLQHTKNLVQIGESNYFLQEREFGETNGTKKCYKTIDVPNFPLAIS